MTREPLYAALFAQIAAAPGLVTKSRKLAHWNDVPSGKMPALFMAQVRETAQVQTGLPTRWTLDVTLWLYLSTKGADAPGPVLNPILDYIAQTLRWSPAEQQTLGGLVHYARIEGAIETSEGTLGNLEVARIPVRIMTTD